MKKLVLISCALLFAISVNAQEWGTVEGNSVTVREIPPVWPGCEEGNVEQRDQCFLNKLGRHVAENYRYPEEEYKNKIQGTVIVEFIINTEGIIEIQKVSGGSEGLQKEAKRNIMLIPKMSKPGMLGGKPRAIPYTVPITFKLN